MGAPFALFLKAGVINSDLSTCLRLMPADLLIPFLCRRAFLQIHALEDVHSLKCRENFL